jgi:hypothetical protein
MLLANESWRDLMDIHLSPHTYNYEKDLDWKAFESRLKAMSYYRVQNFL